MKFQRVTGVDRGDRLQRLHDHQSQNSSAQLRPLLMSLLVSVYGEVGTKILNVAMEAATKVYIR